MRADAELYCPDYGTRARDTKIGPPLNPDYQEFKKWAAKLYPAYLTLYEQDATLRACWEREAKKRLKKSS